MNKEELIKKFDDFVLRNAKHVCSVTGLKALSSLADAKKGGLKKILEGSGYEIKAAATFINIHAHELTAIVPSIKHVDYEKERDALNKLLKICKENEDI